MSEGHKEHVINDPIHGVMEFSAEEKEIIKAVIDLPSFQRLRHIKQLGMTDIVFPGAVHTRFNHSLGAAYVAALIARQLDFGSERKNTLIIAALLHDIGHGPFSHAFENIFAKEDEKSQLKHEDWTSHFLKEIKSESKLHFSVNEIEALIRHKSKNYLNGDIISSQLDADRLDYLLRDSHFCGVSYGKFDLKWLIHCLVEIDEAKKSPRLGITRKGVGVVEHYLIARRSMTLNIYYHGKVKAAEHLLVEFLRELQSEVIGRGSLKNKRAEMIFEFLEMAARANLSTANGKKKFLKKSFRIYKRMADFDIWGAIRHFSDGNTSNRNLSSLASKLYNRRLPKVYRIESGAMEGVSHMLKEFGKSSKMFDRDIGLICPPLSAYKGEEDPILIRNSDGTSYQLIDSSSLVDSIADKKERACFLRIDADVSKSRSSEILKLLMKKQYLRHE